MQKVLSFLKGFGIPVLSLFFPILASAAVLQGPPNVRAPSDVLNDKTQIDALTCAIVNWLFYGLLVFSIIMVLLAAYGYLTSNGDPEKTKGASHKLLYAAVAIVIGLVAQGFPNLIASFFGHADILQAC